MFFLHWKGEMEGRCERASTTGAEAGRPRVGGQPQTQWDRSYLSTQKEGMEVTPSPQNYISVNFHSSHTNCVTEQPSQQTTGQSWILSKTVLMRQHAWAQLFSSWLLLYSLLLYRMLVIKEFSWHLTIFIISKQQRVELWLQLKSRTLA